MGKRVIKGTAKSDYQRVVIKIELSTSGFTLDETDRKKSRFANLLMDLLRQEFNAQDIKIEA